MILDALAATKEANQNADDGVDDGATEIADKKPKTAATRKQILKRPSAQAGYVQFCVERSRQQVMLRKAAKGPGSTQAIPFGIHRGKDFGSEAAAFKKAEFIISKSGSPLLE